ncbi:MAG: hypothetical protein V4649_13410 [Bacteroidota bacterium]
MNNTQTIAVAARQSLRERLAWKIAYGLRPLYFAMRKHRKAWGVTYDDLALMPEGTLGNDLAKFLYTHQLAMMPRAEFHDVYHVLFNYGTNIRDESCIQFVPVGNGRRTLPYLVCIAVTMAFYPEYWGDFYKAYQTGRRANKFHDWDFEPMLCLKTEEVRRIINCNRLP